MAWKARRKVPFCTWSTMRASSAGAISNSAHQSMKLRLLR